MSEETTQNLPNDPLNLILARLNSIDSRLDGVDSRLDAMNSRLDGMDSLLTTLEDKVDRRLQETRPIWERALAEIAQTRAEMHEGFEKLHAEVGTLRADMNTGLRRVERMIDVLNRNVLEVRADLREFDERLTKLESEHAP